MVALFVILVALLMTKDDKAVVPPRFASNVILPAAPGFKVKLAAPSTTAENVMSLPFEVKSAVLPLPFIFNAPFTVMAPLVVIVKLPDIVDAPKVKALLSTIVTLFPLVIATLVKLLDAFDSVIGLLDPAAKVAVLSVPFTVNAPV